MSPEYEVTLSPESMDVILSGPIPVLDELTSSDIRVLIDLTDYTTGLYQVEPLVELDMEDLLVESKLPASIEVEISNPADGTATPTP